MSGHSTCKSPICDILRQLAKSPNKHEKKFLILTKGSSQPISIDGMDSTVFTLEHYSSSRCLAELNFYKEDVDSSYGITSAKGKLVLKCRDISGIFFLNNKHEVENDES